MKRREFLKSSSGLAGAFLLPGLAGAQSKPCPPPELSAAAGSTVTTACGSDFAADWLTRSTAAGVTYAENWSGYADAAAAFGALPCIGANKSPSQGSTFTNAFEIIATPGHVLSGKAMRLWLGKNNYGNAGTIDNQYWTIALNGNRNALTGQFPTGAYLTRVYIQVCIWVDSYIDYLWHCEKGPSSEAPKFFIVDCDYETASTGEFVVMTQAHKQFIHGYRYTSEGHTSDLLLRQWNGGVGLGKSPDFQWQNGVDDGAPASPSTGAQYMQRYGVFYGTPAPTNQSLRLSQQGVPNADAAQAGVPWNRGGMTVVEVELDLENDRARMWAAWHGSAPRLIGDSALDNTNGGFAKFGNRVKKNGIGWNALHLSNLIYTATGALNPNYPTDAYIDFAEIIVSQNRINFPGGFPLP